MSHRLLLLGTLLIIALCGARARAENEGQTYLDKATEAKLGAESLADLGEVIDLCEQALKAGLDDANKEFASKLLAGTLFQRAEVVCAEIFERPTPSRSWPQLRKSALMDLERSLKTDAAQPQAHYLIARLHVLPGGEKKRARQALDDAVRLAGSEPAVKAKALILRASLREKTDERQADFDQAIKLTPHDADVLRARGLFHLMQNKYEQAIADLNAAIELDPKHAESFEARGVAYLFQKKFDQALENFDKAIDLAPESAVAYSHRARVHAIKGNTDKALTDLDKALEIAPRAASLLLLRARVLQQAKDVDKALVDVEKVLSSQPGLIEALQLRAALAAGAGDFDRAIQDLQELLKAEPDNTDLLLQLAVLYTAAKQHPKSLKTFGALLAKDPKNGSGYRGRADVYLSIGKQGEAIADYESALKFDPDNSGVLNNLAWVLATSPDENRRDGKRAIELATKACKLTDFKQAHILSTLAASYAEAGDFDAAISWSKKAVEAGDENLKPQLNQELSSYQGRKPWRELQSSDTEPYSKPQVAAHGRDPQTLPAKASPPKNPATEEAQSTVDDPFGGDAGPSDDDAEPGDDQPPVDVGDETDK